MKYHLLALLALSLLSGRSYAAGSVINITGTVRDNTCVVSAASRDMTVNLQSYSSKTFTTVGAASGMVPFTLTFSSCGSAASAVKVGFTGVADTTNSILLKIDGGNSTDAQGIGVEILDKDQTVLPLNQSADDMTWHTLTAGQQNSLNFYARMVSTTSPVTAGLVNASATITLEFE